MHSNLLLLYPHSPCSVSSSFPFSVPAPLLPPPPAPPPWHRFHLLLPYCPPAEPRSDVQPLLPFFIVAASASVCLLTIFSNVLSQRNITIFSNVLSQRNVDGSNKILLWRHRFCVAIQCLFNVFLKLVGVSLDLRVFVLLCF